MERLWRARGNAERLGGREVGSSRTRVADLYVHVSDKSSLWDACGPEAILHAAGGRFVHVDGTPISYASAELKNTKGILACNVASFERVRDVVRAVSVEEGFLPA